MVWTPADTQSFLSWIHPWLGSINVSFNVIAIFTFYIFKKRRQFPATLLAWICVFNITYGVNLLIKWSPLSLAREPETKLPIVNSLCRFGLFIDQFTAQGVIATNTLVCIMLFSTVVRRKSLEYHHNPHYFWAFIFYLAVAITIIPIVGAVAGSGTSVSGTCVAQDSFDIYLIFLPDAMQIVAQVFLLIPVFFSARKIYKNAQDLTKTEKAKKKDNRMLHLVARFVILWVAQCLGVFPITINTFTTAIHAPVDAESMAKALGTNRSVAGIIEALVIILMNPNVIKWFKVKFMNKEDTSGSGSGTTKQVTMETKSNHESSKNSAIDMPDVVHV